MLTQKNRGKVYKAKSVKDILNSLKNGTRTAIVMHTKNCSHCTRFLKKTVNPLNNELPYDIHIINVNKNVAKEATTFKPLQTMLQAAGRVPATIVLEKSGSGELMFTPMVGHMGQTYFLQALEYPSNFRPLL